VLKDLDQALAEISAIRSQIARTVVFRGYGPVTVAATGLLALVAAGVQAELLDDAAGHVRSYVALWAGTAVLCASVVGVEMITRTRRAHGGLAQEMLATAVEQFVPAAAAGSLLTLVVLAFAPEVTWMLPGLWQVIVGLGVFASCRFLPPAIFWVGAWYLTAGLGNLALARGALALSPAAMGVGFGVGQLLTAAILWLHGEGGEGDE
jgi:hypothetical protein